MLGINVELVEGEGLEFDMGKVFHDFEDPTIAAGIYLPLLGEVAYIHSMDYPADLGFRPGKTRLPSILPKEEKRGKNNELDFGDIL
jgi:hypothetical protein